MAERRPGDTRLRRRRQDLGLAQEALARAAGLSRQALSALEAGRALPSLPTALALARALGTTVEALFAPPAAPDPAAPWAGEAAPDGRARWARVDGRLVLRPPPPGEEPDAVLEDSRRLRPLPWAAAPEQVLWLGGCDPALPLLARAVARAAPHLRVAALPMTSAEAAAELRAGRLHVASLHGDDPAPPAAGAAMLPYATWREGFVLGPGLSPADLGRAAVRWALRPPGATARDLFERHRPGPAPAAVHLAAGHWEVAAAVRAGEADAGVAVEAAAAAHGLAFLPLAEERVVLAVHPSHPEAAETVARALEDARLWQAVLSLRGYRRAS
ncbi:MAG: helix-turn-helix domain-containing protein [Firmicutes bacterium]|nr:helix-turn-helix domain-containing protein [Bacillota bacterium]